MTPLVSEVVIPEPEPEPEPEMEKVEEPATGKQDLTLTAEESLAVFPSEVIPAAIEAKTETEPLEAPAKHDLESTAEESPAVFTTTTGDIIIKPAEEAKVDGETTAVAAVATGIAVASAAAVITDELPTAQPSLVEATTTKDHSADIPAIEAVSTQVDAPPEPTVEHDDVPPLSTTVGPDVGSSLEVKAETEPLESDNTVVEGTPIEPGEIVEGQTEDRAEVEASPTTLAVPTSVADVAPITTEAITEVGETVGVLDQVTLSSFFFDRNNIY